MFRFLFIILGLSSAMTFAQPPSAPDKLGVDAFIQNLSTAWNSHQPKTISNFWVEDGDLITPWGRWMIGQNKIEKYFEQESQGPFAKSVIHQTVDSRRIVSAESVFVDASIRITGIQDPKGYIPPDLLQHAVYLLKKVNDQWKIVSARIYMFQPQHVE